MNWDTFYPGVLVASALEGDWNMCCGWRIYIIIYMIVYYIYKTNIKSIQTSNSCGKKNNVCGSFVQVGTVLVRVGVSRNPFAIHQGRRKNQ